MSICIFLVGNREISIKKENKHFSGYLDNYGYIKKDHIRSVSKNILENISQYANSIVINIIPNVIKKYNPNKIYLISTDQSQKSHSEQDTIYFAKIIKHILEKEEHITICHEVYKDNPTDEEKAFEFTKHFILSHSDEFKKEEIILCESGGTKQMIFPFKFIFSDPEYKNVIVVRVNDKDGKVIEVPFKSYIRKYLIVKQIYSFINSFDYIQAKKLYEKYSEILNDNFLKESINYLVYRYTFNILKAKEKLDELLKEYINKNNDLRDIKNDIINVKLRDNKNNSKKKKSKNSEEVIEFDLDDENTLIFLLRELYFNMLLKLDNEEYADFIARLHSFRDNYSWYLIKKDCIDSNVVSVDFKLFEFKDHYKDYLNKILIQLLEKKGLLNEFTKEGSPTIGLTPPFFTKYVSDAHIKIKGELSIINKLIDKKRHKSYIAHEFNPVNMDTTKVTQVKDALKELLSYININTNNDPYRCFNKIILNYISNNWLLNYTFQK